MGKSGKTIKEKFSADVENAQFKGVFHILPSQIRVDMRDNVRKTFYRTTKVVPEIKDWAEIGDHMCFSRAEIEQRLASFLATSPRGQKQECEVYLTADGHPVLSDGYLRWSAMALAEATGVMGNIAGAKKGLRCIVVPRPEKAETRIAYEFGRLTSNDETLPMTDIDRGYAYDRILKTSDLTVKQLAERVGVNVNTVNTYIRLTTAKLRVQLDLREGRTTKSAVLADLSKQGEGTSRGPNVPRAGVKHSRIQQVFETVERTNYAKDIIADTELKFTVQEMLDTIAWIGGVKDKAAPEFIRDLIEKAPPPPRRGRGPGKKKKTETKATDAHTEQVKANGAAPKKRGK